jgi:hypothetical protein
MGYSPKRSAAAANAACNGVVDLLDGGTIKIYTVGAGVPATVAAAVDGGSTLLATLTFGTPAFGASSSGVATANAITPDSSADATGTASFFRILTSGAVATLQGLCGTSASDLNLNTLSIVIAATVSVSAFTITEPLQ